MIKIPPIREWPDPPKINHLSAENVLGKYFKFHTSDGREWLDGTEYFYAERENGGIVYGSGFCVYLNTRRCILAKDCHFELGRFVIPSKFCYEISKFYFDHVFTSTIVKYSYDILYGE